MLFANWLDVPDAMAFLDAFAEAAEKTRGWKLHSIKTDFGHQFVYVRYTGHKFAGKGLMVSAFAPVRRYGSSLASKALTPDPSPKGRGEKVSGDMISGGLRPRLHTLAPPGRKDASVALRVRKEQPSPSLVHQVSMERHRFLQGVNITLCAEKWSDHVCFDEVAKSLLAPILKEAKKAAQSFPLALHGRAPMP